MFGAPEKSKAIDASLSFADSPTMFKKLLGVRTKGAPINAEVVKFIP